MSFDLQKMQEGKRALRRELAARPLAEKLAWLDVLRERALALRSASPQPLDENSPDGTAMAHSAAEDVHAPN